jgi:hypothetical protein
MRTEIKIALQIFGLKIELGIFMPWPAVGIEAGSPKGGWRLVCGSHFGVKTFAFGLGLRQSNRCTARLIWAWNFNTAGRA